MNSQDAECDVVVPVVVPIVVHVSESAVLAVAHDEPVVVTVGFSDSASLIAPTHPYHQKQVKYPFPVDRTDDPLFGSVLPKARASSS